MSLFYRYNNIPDGYVPKNETGDYKSDEPTLILNATNSYVLTFDFTTEFQNTITQAEWIFKRGFDEVLTKVISEENTLRTAKTVAYKCNLLPLEANLFHQGDDAEMQMKFTTSDNKIMYSINYRLQIIDTIDSNIE